MGLVRDRGSPVACGDHGVGRDVGGRGGDGECGQGDVDMAQKMRSAVSAMACGDRVWKAEKTMRAI